MSWLIIRWIILFSVSLILTILPLPAQIIWFEPSWPLLLLIYMLMFERVSWVITSIILIGYALDVIQVDLLGEHAFAFALSLWLAAFKIHRFRYFVLNQQMMFVGAICFSYGGGLCLIDVLIGGHMTTTMLLQIFAQAVTGGFLWLWIKGVLDDCLETSTRLSVNKFSR